MGTRVVAWRRTDEDAGHSLARVERRDGGWLFHGAEVLAGPQTLLACSFRVEVDDAWATRRVEATAVSARGERRLVLTADHDRRWTRDGEPVPGLEVTRVEQTYRRLGPSRWRYSDDAHGAFELTVDDDGLVVEYTGMATRVAG